MLTLNVVVDSSFKLPNDVDVSADKFNPVSFIVKVVEFTANPVRTEPSSAVELKLIVTLYLPPTKFAGTVVLTVHTPPEQVALTNVKFALYVEMFFSDIEAEMKFEKFRLFETDEPFRSVMLTVSVRLFVWFGVCMTEGECVVVPVISDVRLTSSVRLKPWYGAPDPLKNIQPV